MALPSDGCLVVGVCVSGPGPPSARRLATHDAAWHGMAWHGMAWRGVWRGVAWRGWAWRGWAGLLTHPNEAVMLVAPCNLPREPPSVPKLPPGDHTPAGSLLLTPVGLRAPGSVEAVEARMWLRPGSVHANFCAAGVSLTAACPGSRLSGGSRPVLATCRIGERCACGDSLAAVL